MCRRGWEGSTLMVLSNFSPNLQDYTNTPDPTSPLTSLAPLTPMVSALPLEGSSRREKRTKEAHFSLREYGPRERHRLSRVLICYWLLMVQIKFFSCMARAIPDMTRGNPSALAPCPCGRAIYIPFIFSISRGGFSFCHSVNEPLTLSPHFTAPLCKAPETPIALSSLSLSISLNIPHTRASPSIFTRRLSPAHTSLTALIVST
ncbi:CYFA0S06e01805g1_1 [Cyberlindnera fabianii]|uniref:CYFA0S06e01805g1_1 n=1 Tax=Cyberlindnera fabianii TaxID=36022 RepID=A0A061B0G0_CYBFA|nr:CYFA0S06e01805g1_1 [Cyberlindnera fabianii]